jgi:hypothetical protein
LTGNSSFYGKFFPLTRNSFIWQEIVSFDRKSFHLTGNHFIWQEIISFHREIFPLTGNNFLQQESVSLHFFAGNYNEKGVTPAKYFAWGPRISWEPGTPPHPPELLCGCFHLITNCHHPILLWRKIMCAKTSQFCTFLELGQFWADIW